MEKVNERRSTTRILGILSFLAALIFLGTPRGALALDPSRPVNQLTQTTWGTDRGAPSDISSISQSPDGFLWLGTSSGLYRFDGVAFEQVPRLAGDRTRSRQVVSVLAARDGSVWVGYLWGSPTVYRNGEMRDSGPGFPPALLTRILGAPDGTIWAGMKGVNGSPVVRLKQGRWVDAGYSLGLPAGNILGMAIGHDGTLWFNSDRFVAALSRGARRYISWPAMGGIGLVEDRVGRMWTLGVKGVRSLTLPSGAPPKYEVVSSVPYSGCGVFDRDGNLFACRPDATLGVVRPWMFDRRSIRSKKTNNAPETIKLTLGQPLSVFEDREGNVWVGASGGLTQIRSTNVEVRPFQTQLDYWGPRMAKASDGKLFFGDYNDLEVLNSAGSVNRVGKIGSKADRIVTLCADKGEGLWIALESTPLYHWASGRFVWLRPPRQWELRSLDACAVDRAGDLWASVDEKGLFRRHGGVWKRMVVDPARPDRDPVYVTGDQQGRVLVYFTRGNLYRLDGTNVEEIASKENLGVNYVRTIRPGAGGLLVGGEDGITRIIGNRLQTISSDQHPWLAAVSGIVETSAGDIWLNAAQGLARVRARDLEAAFVQPNRAIPHELFGHSDGLQGSVRNLANFEGGLTADGQVVFQTNTGLMWIDPNHVHHNTVSPPVVIKAITVDHRVYPAENGLVLPAGAHSLQIDYTALSLTVPNRVQFRYRLPGVDRDWVDPGSRRQAFYTNLTPGQYTFDVIAANDDGVWNRTGASLKFRILPTFWQTPVFAVLVVIAALGLFWLVYALQVRNMAHRIRLRLEGRLAERERIARELHDTLLQGFQGLTLRFQSVAKQIPETEPTRRMMDRALELADEVLVDGRDRVRNLRAQDGQTELAFRIEAAAYRLRLDPEVAIEVSVNGDCKPVDPMVADEVLAIASEALFNAFKHSRATQIKARLEYEQQAFHLTIADNGVGIDPHFLERIGRPGHYGFVGMRERARRLKAELLIRNIAEGAEVCLRVPRQVAYARLAGRWSLFPRPVGLEP